MKEDKNGNDGWGHWGLHPVMQHRRASRICNDFELVGGVFDADMKRGSCLQKTKASLLKML